MGSRAKHLVIVACVAVGLSLVARLAAPKVPLVPESPSDSGATRVQQAELFVHPGDEVELAGSARSRFDSSTLRDDADRSGVDEWSNIAQLGKPHPAHAPSGQLVV